MGLIVYYFFQFKFGNIMNKNQLKWLRMEIPLLAKKDSDILYHILTRYSILFFLLFFTKITHIFINIINQLD